MTTMPKPAKVTASYVKKHGAKPKDTKTVRHVAHKSGWSPQQNKPASTGRVSAFR